MSYHPETGYSEVPPIDLGRQTTIYVLIGLVSQRFFASKAERDREAKLLTEDGFPVIQQQFTVDLTAEGIVRLLNSRCARLSLKSLAEALGCSPEPSYE